MKKLILISVFILSVIVINAQQGRVYSVTPDTLNGAETVNYNLSAITGGYETLTIQALCTQIGGTSDGTLIIQGSVDGASYVTLQDDVSVMKSYPNDTLTITNGAIVTWIIKDTPYNYYRIQGAGTASDSTFITPKYVYK